jgi:type II secretory pathway pseudopilin PulG
MRDQKTHKTKRIEARRAPVKRDCATGFTLVEGLVAISLLGSLGLLLMGTFSFSVATQQEARTEIEAARSSAQMIEILRASSFDALDLVEDGTLGMDPLGKFQQIVLEDIEDRLRRDGLNVFLNVEPYLGRDDAKLLTLTIVSEGVSPRITQDQLPPGKILVRHTTIVTRKGINP